MTPSYSQNSKKTKACALTRETIALEAQNAITNPKGMEMILNIVNILNNLKSLFI